jgi:L-amino acid N-acyltransferase YncA
VKYSENEPKRLHQTAEIEANNLSIRLVKRQKVVKDVKAANEQRRREIEEKEDESNPFSPSIDMYLRPALEKDASSIATIYNYYINNSIIPEDQEVIQESDVLYLITSAKDMKLPFVVAVRGREPPTADAQGRPAPKTIMPQFESIIGFAFTEIFNFGFSGSRNGRSRATANLQLYVHIDWTHKGVGRNLLDRLIHSMNPAYAFMGTASWINPENNKTYDSKNLVKWHQMFFQFPVDGKNDQTFYRVREFLAKFFFTDVARLRSGVRKSIHPGPAKFVDLVIFQAEATNAEDFDVYV